MWAMHSRQGATNFANAIDVQWMFNLVSIDFNLIAIEFQLNSMDFQLVFNRFQITFN